MDYYDGNTVTGLWNYAQNYAMSDNFYDTNYGPSTPGALNLISGDDGGGFAVDPITGAQVPDPGSIGSSNAQGVGTTYGDLDPAFDDCSDASHTSANPVGVMTGENIGNLLNQRHITWGWFQGGFAPTGSSGGYAVCGATHNNIGGIAVQDYVPHHDPFQYYASTANPKHLPPTSEAAIGRTCRTAICRRSVSSRPPPTRTGTPGTPTRWTSRPSW
jgi:phospholipase C